MDETNNNSSSVKSRKNEAKTLLKKCFKNDLFSFVPFEIWKDSIVSNADLQAVVLLSQTCWGFKEVFDSMNNLTLAKDFRRQSQTALARRYLQKCADNGNTTAMLHLGFAYKELGWGLEKDELKAVEWFKKSADRGNTTGMAFYALSLFYGVGLESNEKLSRELEEKILSSKDSFAIGCCYFESMTKGDRGIAFRMMQTSANEGNEFGQNYLAACFEHGIGTVCDLAKAFEWYLKSAEQGFCASQEKVFSFYSFGKGCEKDYAKAIFWLKKAIDQRSANHDLDELRRTLLDLEKEFKR